MSYKRLVHIHGPSGQVGDQWHTLDELYEHRYVLFILLAQAWSSLAWKSRVHADGTMDRGFFIAGLDLPTGAITYHLPLALWNRVPALVLPTAPPWDGHTSFDVLDRLWAYAEEQCHAALTP